ncbi:unnamed protein product [Fusarium equiseti]|uniref:Uncharacterized protein n=1 Tax=Fusarium equiseti TaxID=61235 RepID=A0A8J2IPN7_FUSEQ|nr:unnamed protein product [Fusarium equiseti]
MAADTVSSIANKVQTAPSVLAFLAIGLLQGLTVSILQGIVVLRWYEWITPRIIQVGAGYDIPANLAIFIFGFLFELGFMIDAIRLKSTAQAMLTCVLNAGFLPLAIYQSTEMKGRIDQLKGSIDANRQPIVHLEIPIWEQIGGMLRAMPYIVGICTGLLVVSVWYLKQYFDWQAYRNVGADARLRRIRTIHQIFVMLAKADIYFIISFEVYFGVTERRGQGTEFIIRMVVLAIAVVITCLSIVWSKSENRIGMAVSISAFLAMIGYLIYMVILSVQGKRFASFASISNCYAAMAIGFLFFTTIFAILCLRNFYGGLKEHLEKHEEGGTLAPSVKNFEMDSNVSFEYQSVRSTRDLDS